MNKTLLYVTAAAGLIASGAALADAANVEVYGTLNVDFQNLQAVTARSPAAALPAGSQMGATSGSLGSTCCSATGAIVPNAIAPTAATGQSQPSRNQVQSNSSNIGFRGNEDLGMGLKAIFQIEAQVNMTGSNSATSTSSATPNGTFASRNSNVGLSSSKLGTIFYGIWDMPTKVLHNSIDAWYATGMGSGNAIYGTPGFGVVTTTQTGRNGGTGTALAADASFDRREGNSVQYWTPKLYGFSARLAYQANSQESIQTPAAPAFSINPHMYGASVSYEHGFDKYGSFTVGYTFEQHKDFFGLAALGGNAPSATNYNSQDTDNSVVLSYKFDTSLGTTTIGALWERLSYNNNDTTPAAATLEHYSRDAFYFPLLHKIGATTIRASFGDALQGSCTREASACSTSGLNARQYTFGGSYSFSKRTDVYALWSQTDNGPFAAYQLGNNNPAYSTTIPVGSRQRGIGLGIRHVF